ncbi:MAG: BatA domain-containing protein [Cyclobacteriaceae bacterium]|nr:BatA domain-containing protein [Cyclobacteriaceae bacterium]
MQLVNPIYLWALLALAVPVAIHLLSRKEGKVIPIGSLRHLQETASQQFRGIKLNEIFLLALRLLLLILFVLLLAGLFRNKTEKEKWVIVDSQLKSNRLALAWADSLTARGYQWHWLSENFPAREQTPTPIKNYWQRVTALGGLYLEHAVVLSANRVVDFKGKIVPVPEYVDWQTFELPDTTCMVYQLSRNDKTLARKVKTSSAQTILTTDTLEAILNDGAVIDSIRVAVVADKDFEEEEKLIHAALKAAQKLPVQVIVTHQAKADWIIWLSKERLPDVQAKILFAEHTSSDKLIEQVAPMHWRLNKLSVENMLQQNFTIQLADLLTDNKSVRERIDAVDRRMLQMPKQQDKVPAHAAFITHAPVNTGLLIFFVMVWIAERTVAFLRRQ